MKTSAKYFFRAWVCAFVCVLFPFSVLAFVNVESLRQVSGKGHLGKTGLQVTGQQGNTNKFSSQVSTINILRDEMNEWLFTGNYKYGESGYLKDTNQGGAHLRHTWNVADALAYEAFIQTSFDEFKELNSRNYIGGNLRFRLVYEDAHRLFLGLGSFYEMEDFSTDTDKEGFRGNIYLSQTYHLTETVLSSVILYYQPKFSQMENYRLRLQAGVDVKISEKVNLDLDANVVHDTGLPPDVKQTDIDYLVGFSINY